ncbi:MULTISPECIES: hypothetical protein [Burkholderia cepacia complex]|uniref:hypothetical protein n=1 Tax=Burkholderia cenocepacia TaxID=95486 RepID=UPI0022374113|nr:hypothetical protein [Burkholderia cenocepacia]MCW5156435.1 hypothetical protein [Burkholderia cenocepacia]
MRIYSTNKLTIKSGIAEVKLEFVLPYTDTKLVGAMIECNPQLEVELVADEFISTDCGFYRLKIAGKAGVVEVAEGEYVDMHDLYGGAAK